MLGKNSMMNWTSFNVSFTFELFKGIVLRKMHFFFLSFLDSRGLMLSFEQKKFWGPYAKWCPRGGAKGGSAS